MKYAVVFDIGKTNIRASLINSKGAIIDSTKSVLKINKLFIENYIKENFDFFIKTNSLNIKNDIKGIGICVGSSVKNNGQVSWVKKYNFSNYNIKKKIEKLLGIKVAIENDLNAAAMGEKWLGSLKNVNNGGIITFSTGVGSGVIINGKLYRGNDGFAGGVGHTVVDTSQKLKCNAGHTGCLDILASGSGVAYKYNLGRKIKVTASEILSRSLQGDIKAKKIIKEASMYIGIGISNFINCYNPEVLLLHGGFLFGIWPYYKNDILKETVKRSKNQKAKIKLSKLGDKAGILGVAYMVFNS